MLHIKVQSLGSSSCVVQCVQCVHVVCAWLMDRYWLGGGVAVWEPKHQNFQVERPEAGNRYHAAD